MVPRGGVEPPTQGFSVILNIEQDDKFKKSCSHFNLF